MIGILVLRNRQRVRPVDLRMLRRLALWALAEFFPAPAHELCIHLVNDREMAGVNELFLNHPGSTDVITFDHSDVEMPQHRPKQPRGSHAENRRARTGAMNSFHGEIYISLSDAVTQARSFRGTWQSEVVRYLIHGLLHLQGFKDGTAVARRRMKREENRLVKLVARQFRIGDLARRKI